MRAAVQAALESARQSSATPDATVRLGMILHAHGQLAAAASVYRRALQMDNSKPDQHYYLGVVLAAAGNNQDAIQAFRSSLKLRDSVPVRLALAGSLYSAGQVADAAHEYRALTAANPQLATAWYGLGQCQKGAEAVESLSKAVSLFPHYGAARFALASAYRQMGRQSDAAVALANYERDKFSVPPLDDPAIAAVQALDVSPQGLMRAAQSLERMGQLRESAQLLERGLAADPTLTQAAINLIAIYGRINEPAKAADAYRKAIALDPRSAEANYNYAVLCLRQERLSDARRALERTIAADPTHASALDSLGAIVETTGNWAAASDLFRRAIAADPNLRYAHFHLGRIYANQKRYSEAIAELSQTQEPIDVDTPGFLYALGATHARAGHREQAIRVLERARDLAATGQATDLSASIGRDLATLRNSR